MSRDAVVKAGFRNLLSARWTLGQMTVGELGPIHCAFLSKASQIRRIPAPHARPTQTLLCRGLSSATRTGAGDAGVLLSPQYSSAPFAAPGAAFTWASAGHLGRGAAHPPPAALGGGAAPRRTASVKANNVRVGALLEQDKRLLVVLKAQHTPGIARQGGNVQLELRDLKTGSKSNLKVSTDTLVQVAETQRKSMSYLYHDDEGVHLMDGASFEQLAVPLEVAGEDVKWLSDGIAVNVLLHEGSPVSLELPVTMVVTVTETPEDRVSESGAKKAATVSTGAKVMVPAFVQAGEEIVVKPATAEFVRRHKE